MLSDTLGLEEFSVDLISMVSEEGEVFESFATTEVDRPIDGGFGSEGSSVFEVLLDVRELEVDMDGRGDVFGDDAGPIAKGRGWVSFIQLSRKQEADTVRATEIEMVSDDLFEEEASMKRSVENLSEADLHLPDGEFVIVASSSISRRQGPWEVMGPSVKESLHMGAIE